MIKPYTFVEIGAGFGHWSVTAATVYRRIAEEVFGIEEAPLKLLMVDPLEGNLMEAAKQANLNGLGPGTIEFIPNSMLNNGKHIIC